MKLSLVSIEKAGPIRVAAEGLVTADDFDSEAANPLGSLLGETWSNNNVLLDLSRVTYIDSSAIGWLISCHRGFKAGGGRFIVHSIQPAVKQILDMLRIGQVVSLAEDEAAARALLNGAAT
jgi:anti-anti-sigma factor